MRRGFLQDLEQGIESPGAEHVHLVDDVDFEARSARAKRCIASQLTNIVDPRIARGVDLDHIDVLTLGHQYTGVALTAGRGRWRVVAQTVERFGQDSGHGRLAHAARARKEIPMMHAVRSDGVGQRGRDRGLPHNLIEGAAAIGSG